MPDERPPRLDGDERETLRALLQYLRESLIRKVTGVDDAAARRALGGSGTTLLWLIRHVARVETSWIQYRFAGEDVDRTDGTVNPDDTLAAAVDAYRTTWTRVDAVVAAAPSLDEACRNLGGETPVNLRWVLMHVIEETARHAGHADIIRELIDGQIGR